MIKAIYSNVNEMYKVVLDLAIWH